MLLNPIDPSTPVPLRDEDAARPEEVPRGSERKKELKRLRARLEELGGDLFAEGRRALLVILQGRDAGGKDGTIRKVFGAVNPQGLHLTSFGAPAGEETRHDFLWRVHRAVPPFGGIGLFNRSHYEDVLAARVRRLVPAEVWERRYEQINAFERMLSENGVSVLKLFLHISRDEQKRRLLDRLEKPHKRWKFEPSDLEDRVLWDEYTAAYQDVFARCSTADAPWYVVPADHKGTRNLLVARIVVDTLERMAPRVPEADPEVLSMADQIL